MANTAKTPKVIVRLGRYFKLYLPSYSTLYYMKAKSIGYSMEFVN